jgi:hypothetical protein
MSSRRASLPNIFVYSLLLVAPCVRPFEVDPSQLSDYAGSCADHGMSVEVNDQNQIIMIYESDTSAKPKGTLTDYNEEHGCGNDEIPIEVDDDGNVVKFYTPDELKAEKTVAPSPPANDIQPPQAQTAETPQPNSEDQIAAQPQDEEEKTNHADKTGDTPPPPPENQDYQEQPELSEELAPDFEELAKISDNDEPPAFTGVIEEYVPEVPIPTVAAVIKCRIRPQKLVVSQCPAPIKTHPAAPVKCRIRK